MTWPSTTKTGTECKFFYQLKAKKNDNMMLSLRPVDDLPCVSHLVCKNARDRLHDSAANEEGWDEAAEEHLAEIQPSTSSCRRSSAKPAGMQP